MHFSKVLEAIPFLAAVALSAPVANGGKFDA